MTKHEANYDQFLEARRVRREERDYLAYMRMARREEAADRMIGELMRDGKAVLYVQPPGGRYWEGTRRDLINFLIRNRYV